MFRTGLRTGKYAKQSGLFRVGFYVKTEGGIKINNRFHTPSADPKNEVLARTAQT